jgi:hypothetical protein
VPAPIPEARPDKPAVAPGNRKSHHYITMI